MNIVEQGKPMGDFLLWGNRIHIQVDGPAQCFEPGEKKKKVIIYPTNFDKAIKVLNLVTSCIFLITSIWRECGNPINAPSE